MVQDLELERIKGVQERAHQKMQSAYVARQAAWRELVSVREEMKYARDAKQRAYELQGTTWQAFVDLADQYNPVIEKLSEEHQAAYRAMTQAYHNATEAYANGRHAEAAAHAADRRTYKAEMQERASERRVLVEELRVVKEAHNRTRPEFQRAKQEFNIVKQKFDEVCEVHAAANRVFQEAKVAFDEAAKAFSNRLKLIREADVRRREDPRAVARAAGVPSEYLDDVQIDRNKHGGHNVYFGGVDGPVGPEHAHYALDLSDEVSYKREPFEPRGPQNFIGFQGHVD